MKEDTMRLITASAAGAIGGLALGYYLWGVEEDRRRISIPKEKLIEILKDLDVDNELTFNDIKTIVVQLIDVEDQPVKKKKGKSHGKSK